MQGYKTRETCRVCNSKPLTPLFSLGEQYVSDFITREEVGTKEIKCPIDLVMCPNCTLVQLKHTAPQEFLYTRHYWYRSGVTKTMQDALLDVTRTACKCVDLAHGDTVLDIGSNDGTLLRNYRGLRTVGVEPALNLKEEGSKGIDVFINDFWSYDAYLKRGCQPAKVITALGMFYDLENPNQFIYDVSQALSSDGVFIAQLMCLKNMIDTCDIGNLAHEHLEFYSLTSLEFLFTKYGLEIYDIETNTVNNQSYRIFVRHINSRVKARNPVAAAARIHQIRMEEKKLLNPKFYETFFAKMEQNKQVLRKFIDTQLALKKTIWVYGASTKGNVILQYLGLDHTHITAAAEKSEEKWGRFTVGTNIPIVSEAEMRQAKPDYCLVLPYTFINEFIRKEASQQWRIDGGIFIVPFPEMRIY